MSDEVKLKISAELLEELEKTDRTDGPHPNAHRWTEEEDEVIKHYWKSRNKSQVAAALGLSTNTCLKRYRKLVAQGEIDE